MMKPTVGSAGSFSRQLMGWPQLSSKHSGWVSCWQGADKGGTQLLAAPCQPCARGTRPRGLGKKLWSCAGSKWASTQNEARQYEMEGNEGDRQRPPLP